jgi:hypothetical protein
MKKKNNADEYNSQIDDDGSSYDSGTIINCLSNEIS